MHIHCTYTNVNEYVTSINRYNHLAGPRVGWKSHHAIQGPAPLPSKQELEIEQSDPASDFSDSCAVPWIE